MSEEPNDTSLPSLRPTQAGRGCCAPPNNLLDWVFPRSIRDRWRQYASPELIWRLQVLLVCGPVPEKRAKREYFRELRAYKAAWDTYLYTAYACGMFTSQRGDDVLARLRSTDADAFRSAMAECMTCWLLAGKLRFPVDTIAYGRKKKELDLRALIDNKEVGVEVKAPYRPRPTTGGWSGGESGKIKEAIKAANSQFSDDRPNLLVIAPKLRLRIFNHREQLLHAAFGCSQVVLTFDPETGDAGEPEERFAPTGNFLNRWLDDGRLLKPDTGLPGFTRVSAIVMIEEQVREKYPHPSPSAMLADLEDFHQLWPYWFEAQERHYSDDNFVWLGHDVLVVHNPYASHGVAEDAFGNFVQFSPMTDHTQWSDGEKATV